MANYIKDILTINYKSTMKNLVKVFFLGLSLACASCADDENVQSYTQEVKLPHVVAISSSSSITRCSNKNQNEKILAFDSEADFNQFSSYLKGKNSKQREEILSKLGFECLQEINEKADKELEEIGANAKSEEDFKAKYATYKEKYNGILVSNTFDTSDLSLYLPATQDSVVAPFIVGKCNKVLVANSIREIPFSNQMNENDKMVFATDYPEYNAVISRTVEKDYGNEDKWPVNGFKDKTSGKKTIFGCSVNGDKKLVFHFGAQKKMWYGWKRDSRNFFFRLANMQGVHNIDPAAKQSYLNPNTYYFGTNDKFSWIEKIDFTVADATIAPSIVVNEYEITGKVFIWTDRMVERDANNNIIYQSTGDPTLPTPNLPRKNFPLLKIENSFPCKINLVKKR